MRRYRPTSLIKPRISWALTVSNNSFNVETLKYLCLTVRQRYFNVSTLKDSYSVIMRTLKEHMSYCQSTVTVGTLWLIFSIKKI